MNLKNIIPFALAPRVFIKRFVPCLFVFLIVLSVTAKPSQKKSSTAYYFNSETGNNLNNGSLKKPFKDLYKAGEIKLLPGDSILLAGGVTFYGSLSLTNVQGSAENPIVISSYFSGKNGQLATIDAKGYYSGILLDNCSFIKVMNLNVRANGGGMKNELDKNKDMRCGVLVTTSKPGIYRDIVLSRLSVSDIFYEEPGFLRDKREVKTANGTQRYGWGIRFINNIENAFLKDISVKNCVVMKVSHTGIKLTARNNGISNMEISNSRVSDVGGPGIQMSGVYKGIVKENIVNGSGSNNDSRNWARGSGLWTWGTSDVLIEKNQFLNAKGPGDSAGAHIDYNCNNVILQYNLSVNNAGGFCEILGNNHNCAYRYNVSVNDGYRVKGQDGAFQEGKIFWLSGYIGKEKPSGPFNSYFYNNTIYVKKEIEAKIAVAKTSSGICMANNIFVIEGSSSEVQGDQYVPDKKGDAGIKNLVFENNIYLNTSNWPESVLIQDKSPIYGNPGFINKGGLKLTDYTPKNIKLIQDKGIEIPKIPGDSIGLYLGLKVDCDILGHKISGRPDMGAIEILK